MVTSPEIDRIEGDLVRTRERMAGRIDALQRLLVPRQMLNDTFAHFSGGDGGDFAEDLVTRIKASPVPAGIAGAAIAWLLTAKGSSAVRDRVQHPLANGARAAETSATPMTRRLGSEIRLSRAADVRDSHLRTGIPIMTRSTRNPISSVTANPFALGAAAALVGIIAGALIPTTRKEEEVLGSAATKLRVAGRDLAQDVVDRGGHVVEDTLEAVKGGADAHGLTSAKPIGEVFADAKSGDLVEAVKQVAQDTVQAGSEIAQTHLSTTTDEPKPAQG